MKLGSKLLEQCTSEEKSVLKGCQYLMMRNWPRSNRVSLRTGQREIESQRRLVVTKLYEQLIELDTDQDSQYMRFLSIKNSIHQLLKEVEIRKMSVTKEDTEVIECTREPNIPEVVGQMEHALNQKKCARIFIEFTNKEEAEKLPYSYLYTYGDYVSITVTKLDNMYLCRVFDANPGSSDILTTTKDSLLQTLGIQIRGSGEETHDAAHTSIVYQARSHDNFAKEITWDITTNSKQLLLEYCAIILQGASSLPRGPDFN